MAKELNTLVLSKVKSLGVDYFHFTEEQQQGYTFGERITSAIATVFDKGYDHVLTIGNDTVSLEKAHLRKAIKAMHNGEVAVGPSYDGGFYLLGLHKDQFNLEQLRSFTWQSSGLYKEVQAYVKAIEATALALPYLYDLDTTSDISKNLATHSVTNLRALRILQQLLWVIYDCGELILAKAKKITPSNYHNKGSPLRYSS